MERIGCCQAAWSLTIIILVVAPGSRLKKLANNWGCATGGSMV
eukprot:CAMPEP_0178389868 /NCGR_PEP_ID=MMETSP0689_2-20121128/10350_1 /TAXON_ID=160604 /ORGANISM="Amphidinium massartii, Strain CS-259" /LENGTH=42 /DNA_ID= /DNA_START= /DNA_END= /DNA_ORIENTATION=